MDTKNFLIELQEKLDIYMSVFRCCPEKHILDVILRNVNGYLENIKYME
jgi:hypothetical protein